MSNQIIISSGAKVRDLEGVLTGTAGIVNSVGLGQPNGVATLDSSGKVPLSQLPSSVITYLGTWNAATNTPTLTNGVGDVGDLYICNVAGTVNFGAGPIIFAVGDWVIYGSGTWQKSAGASGTVTSVAVSRSGDALSITGSPITTSGTINIGFAGNGSQYIKGDGTLATFPTIIGETTRLITEVYNETGATLSKGTIVYINGGHGNLPTVTKAIATSDATSAQTYGVVQSDITNNNNGYVVVIGSLNDIDTQTYAEGTQLYLSGTTAGAWTSTKPHAPIHLVYVGIVVRSHPTQGVVEIRIQNGYELEELHDVAITSVANNDGIFYNSSNDLWENKTIAEVLGYTPANAATYVPYTGATSSLYMGSSNLISAKSFITSGTSGNGYLKLSNALVAATPEADGVKLSSVGSVDLVISSNTYNSTLVTSGNTANRTYTFPNASGTLALTSDIPSLTNYVTLNTLQTITGVKFFNAEASFDNNIVLTGGDFVIGNSGYDTSINTEILTASRSINFPNKSGVVAMTSDIPSLSGYVQGSGTTNYHAKFTGSGTIGNSMLTDDGTTLTSSGATRSNLYLKAASTSYYSQLAFTNGSSGAFGGLSYNNASQYMQFETNSSEWMRLTSVGYLGIGTTGPSDVLDVQKNSNATTNFYFRNLDTTNTNSRAYLNLISGSTSLIFKTINGDHSYIDATSNLYFQSAGSVKMTMLSSGNVGIGTSSPSQILHLYGSSIRPTIESTGNGGYSSLRFIGKTSGGTSRTFEVGLNIDADNVWQIYNGTSSVFNVNTSGNVGIGTSSPAAQLDITSGSSGFRFFTSTSTQAQMNMLADLGLGYDNAAAFFAVKESTNNSYLSFWNKTSGSMTEKMRITSIGEVAIGASGTGGYKTRITDSRASPYMLSLFYSNASPNVTGDNQFIYCEDSSTSRFIVWSSGTAQNRTGVYGTISDISLKENIVDATSKLDDLLSLKVRNFNFIGEELKQIGFIAQEMEEVFPNMVDTDKEGLKSVKTTVLIPMLVKAIQESHQIIKDLEARIVTLESKIN